MTYLLWTGAFVGLVIGFFNMLNVVSTRLGQPGLKPIKTLWQGLWIWLLWTVFGAYVLVFWIAGLLLLGSAQVVRRRRPAT